MLAQYGKASHDTPIIQRAIVRYALDSRPRRGQPRPPPLSIRCAARIPTWSANWRKAWLSRSRILKLSFFSELNPMTFSVQFGPLAEVGADWLIVPIPEEEGPFGAIADLDFRLDGALTRLKQNGDLTGKALELTTLLDRPGIAARRLLLVGLGKRDQADRAAVTNAAAAAALAITDRQHERIALALPENLPQLEWTEVALAASVGLMQGGQARPARPKPAASRRANSSWQPQRVPRARCCRQTVWRAGIEARPWRWQRWCQRSPQRTVSGEFAAKALEVANGHGIDCAIWDEAKLTAEHMGS